jgi:uncharacterized iron-regulated membrane protein
MNVWSRVQTRGAFALLFALTTVVLNAPDEATAWVASASQGRPGSVQMPHVEATDRLCSQGMQYYSCSSGDAHHSVGAALVSFAGPTVTRSPATNGDQSVTATYYVLRYDGSQWPVQYNQTVRGSIAAGNRAVQLGPLQHQGNYSGSYSLRVIVAWGQARAGDLGALTVGADRQQDLICHTFEHRCAPGNGFVQIG